jgi:hypothetical protein
VFANLRRPPSIGHTHLNLRNDLQSASAHEKGNRRTLLVRAIQSLTEGTMIRHLHPMKSIALLLHRLPKLGRYAGSETVSVNQAVVHRVQNKETIGNDHSAPKNVYAGSLKAVSSTPTARTRQSTAVQLASNIESTSRPSGTCCRNSWPTIGTKTAGR